MRDSWLWTAYPRLCWKRTLQVISCQRSYRLNDLQVLAFHGGGSSAWCTPRNFSAGAVRRGGCGYPSDREISGADEKVLYRVGTVSPSKLSAICFYASVLLWFISYLFQPNFTGLTYFIFGARPGEGKIVVFFSFSFNFLASHWTFIFIFWVAYVQLF